MKKSVQLYAIRALASRDLEQALKVASDIGYDGVEFAGFFGNSAQTVKLWLKKFNLEVSSAHVSDADIFEKTDETIAYHKEIGNTRIICPWADMKTVADVDLLAKKFIEVAPKFKDAGMTLMYHNHAHEFAVDNGKALIDWLAELTSKDVLGLQFDVYWVYNGGADPVKYLEKYADRVELFHAKDGIGDTSTILGEGKVDLEGVVEFAKAHNFTWAVVESEASDEESEQIEAITKDFDVISNLLK